MSEASAKCSRGCESPSPRARVPGSVAGTRSTKSALGGNRKWLRITPGQFLTVVLDEVLFTEESNSVRTGHARHPRTDLRAGSRGCCSLCTPTSVYSPHPCCPRCLPKPSVLPPLPRASCLITLIPGLLLPPHSILSHHPHPRLSSLQLLATSCSSLPVPSPHTRVCAWHPTGSSPRSPRNVNVSPNCPFSIQNIPLGLPGVLDPASE